MISNPDALKLFVDCLPSTKDQLETPWTLDVHTHAAMLDGAVRKAAALAFPILPRPIKSNVAERSWRLIEHRRPFRKTVLGCQSKLRNSWLRACLAGWRGLHRAAWIARREISDTLFHTAVAAYTLETTGRVLRECSAVTGSISEEVRRLNYKLRRTEVTGQACAELRGNWELENQSRRSSC